MMPGLPVITGTRRPSITRSISIDARRSQSRSTRIRSARSSGLPARRTKSESLPGISLAFSKSGSAGYFDPSRIPRSREKESAMRAGKVASTGKRRLSRQPVAHKILPVIEEEIKVGKRTVESGRVVINKRVEERQEIIDEPLLREEVLIRRVAINRPI